MNFLRHLHSSTGYYPGSDGHFRAAMYLCPIVVNRPLRHRIHRKRITRRSPACVEYPGR